MQKFLAQFRSEVQKDGYRRTGHSVYGMLFVVCSFKPKLEAHIRSMYEQEVDAAYEAIVKLADVEGNFVGYHKLGVVLAAENSHTQDSYAALAMLGVALSVVWKQVCWFRKLLLQCDGAPNFLSAHTV
jgi:hypothetical protein